MVGATGFEPATSCTPCKRATKLRYAPLLCASRDSSSPDKSRLVPLRSWSTSEQSLSKSLDAHAMFKRSNDCGRNWQLDAEPCRE